MNNHIEYPTENTYYIMQTQGRFIVIEGLDGIGKSTTIGRLCEQLNAQTASSPTPFMGQIRERFHDAEPNLRNQYYELCNAEFSGTVENMLQQGDVVCDRFVASTASFKLANQECDWQEFQENLNKWCWPSTCRQPDIIIHLMLQEDHRTHRILSRGEPLDQQEARLLEDPSFRIRTLAVFNELCDVTIDITGLSTDQIVKKIRFEIGNDGAV